MISDYNKDEGTMDQELWTELLADSRRTLQQAPGRH